MPRAAKEADKPKGRMSAYAYFLQTCREEHKKKHPNENVVFKEFTKKCADRWRTMSDKEKQRFHEMSEKDKARYDSEMKNYTPAKGAKNKKRKAKKDPNAPKRALSAFFHFCNDMRPEVRKEMPDAGVGEVAKELGKRWAKITDSEKSKYEKQAEKDKGRYEREVAQYKKKKPAGKAAPVEEDEDDDDEEEEEDEDEEDDE